MDVYVHKKVIFLPRLKNQSKRVCIGMKLGTHSVNTPNSISNLQKVYATVHPFPLQQCEQLTTDQSGPIITAIKTTRKRCVYFIYENKIS
jgi:hypothetical protein